LLLLRRVAQGCDPTNIDAAMSADVLHDRFFLLLLGLAIDALFGEMPPLFAVVPHPVVLAGRAVMLLERKLNRPRRVRRRRARGIITVAVVVGGSAALGWALHVLCRGSLAGAGVEALAVGI